MADDMTMMWAEVDDIGGLLTELDDDQFDAPSLCSGWAVRDVLGHMGLGHTVPMGAMLGRIAKYGFNVTKASRAESVMLFAGKGADDIRRFWTEIMMATHPRKGISKMIPARAGFLDHLVHNQDMRRPTGRARTIPEDRLRRALDLARSESSPMFSPKRNVAGLRLVATDVDWSGGDGPEVTGPGEAIVMAASGRAAALADLSGDGLGTLRERITR
ncbi:MAG TPA: maleylpyruvate isomerase family mycothiol-dependent enzyme [Acidimicrobiales bacterium]|nr:maleylpyruvate isomerase family mycothiol-dependent enzyme [Acidimicrobiales bacterium]